MRSGRPLVLSRLAPSITATSQCRAIFSACLVCFWPRSFDEHYRFLRPHSCTTFAISHREAGHGPSAAKGRILNPQPASADGRSHPSSITTLFLVDIDVGKSSHQVPQGSTGSYRGCNALLAASPKAKKRREKTCVCKPRFKTMNDLKSHRCLDESHEFQVAQHCSASAQSLAPRESLEFQYHASPTMRGTVSPLDCVLLLRTPASFIAEQCLGDYDAIF